MNFRGIKSSQLGALGFRLVCGLNLFMHGLVRLSAGNDQFSQYLEKTFANSFLPHSMLTFSSTAIPVFEILAGALILVGFLLPWILFLATLQMGVLIFGMALVQNWEIIATEMIYAISFFLLLNSPHLTYLSLDEYFSKKV